MFKSQVNNSRTWKFNCFYRTCIMIPKSLSQCLARILTLRKKDNFLVPLAFRCPLCLLTLRTFFSFHWCSTQVPTSFFHLPNPLLIITLYSNTDCYKIQFWSCFSPFFLFLTTKLSQSLTNKSSAAWLMQNMTQRQILKRICNISSNFQGSPFFKRRKPEKKQSEMKWSLHRKTPIWKLF